MPGAQAIARSTGGALAGAGLGELSVRAARTLPAEQRVTLYAAGLAFVAAIYPAARRAWRLDRSSAGELLGVVGYGTASVVATRRPRPRATRLLAAGWATHALFDAAHGHDEGPRLPAGGRRSASRRTWSSAATLRAQPERCDPRAAARTPAAGDSGKGSRARGHAGCLFAE
jgi:hypothetical protein